MIMQLHENDIQTRPCRKCHVCGAEGVLIYQGLRDRLFGVPGEWNLKKCANPDCGTYWLDPMPIEADLGKLRKALEAGQFEQLSDGGFRVAGVDLDPGDVLVERTEKPGWTVVGRDGVSVALDSALDDELRLEGRVNDAIHQINTKRKEAGLAISDRIHLSLPASDADLLAHTEWIAAETLALSVDLSADEQIRFTPV